MAKFGDIISKIQLVKQRSGKLTIIAIAIAIVLSMGTLTVLHLSMNELQKRTADLRDQAAQLEAENAELLEDIDQVDSIHGIVEIAQDELGLVEPGAVFYQPEP